MANTSPTGSINQDALVGVFFALLAAIGFSAKAILVKLAYLDHVDAVTLLALRMAFSVPFFIGAVVIAHQIGAPQAALDLLACVFILLRVSYIALYVGDSPTARSVVWGLAFLVNIAILLLGWR